MLRMEQQCDEVSQVSLKKGPKVIEIREVNLTPIVAAENYKCYI